MKKQKIQTKIEKIAIAAKNFDIEKIKNSFDYMKHIFKFISENFCSQILFQQNYIKFSIMLEKTFKKSKFFLMIKTSIEIYHDETPFYRFKNKITKIKIDKLIFLSFKFNRQKIQIFF